MSALKVLQNAEMVKVVRITLVHIAAIATVQELTSLMEIVKVTHFCAVVFCYYIFVFLYIAMVK
jgi:hypothetical protein